jgi:catechol 2,3-dioxygenase-like lactoylglutathione lyase family enzyme
MKRAPLILVLIAVLSLSAFSAPQEFSSKTILIGMIVSDLDESMHFYKDVIGMSQIGNSSFDVDADFGKKSGLTDNLPIHVEILKLGAGNDATQLKLMTFGDRAKKQQNEYLHSHTGIQYLTINVKALQPFIERIKKNNVPFLGNTPIPLGADRHFVLVKDPDGTFVELIGSLEIKPPSDYQKNKKTSGMDKYKKGVPYKTSSRKDVEEKAVESTSTEKKKGIFSFLNVFNRSKDKDKTTTAKKVKAAAKSEPKVESEAKKIRNKFKNRNKTTPYQTPSRSTDADKLIP